MHRGEMKRVALGISYIGDPYIGFQSQKQGNSVQEELEAAIASVANHPVTLSCAGRTDKGVHAMQQVVHFNTSADRSTAQWMRGINAHLSQHIMILWVKQVPENFHARFSATSRAYVYVLNAEQNDLFLSRFSWYTGDLNTHLMQIAANSLVGEHDFKAFQSRHCQADHAIRKIHYITIKQQGNLVFCHIQANAFVHHMVRKIVATLVAIGQERMVVESMGEILNTQNREAVPGQAPAKGLFLKAIGYPDELALPMGIRSQLLGEIDV